MRFPGLASLAGALVLLGAGAPTQAQCDVWQRVATPNFGLARNVFLDADSAGGPLWALMLSADSTGTAAPVEYHVLRHAGNTWIDIGAPDGSSLPDEPDWFGLGVGPSGDVWIGGDVEWHSILPPRPAVARWHPDTGWDAPEMVELLPATQYPYAERTGSVGAIEVVPDGTVYALGRSSNLNSLCSDDTIRPLLLINAGGGWLEIEDECYDWPAGGVSGNYVYDLVAFSATSAWAAGRHGTDAVGPGAIVSRWDGVTHEAYPTPANGGEPMAMEAAAIDALGPDDIWVVGEGSSFISDTALLMHFDGVEWTLFPSPYPSGTSLVNVVMNADGTAWAHPAGYGPMPPTFFDGIEWALRPPIANPPEGDTYSIYELARDGDGTVWGLGLYAVDNFASSASFAVRLECGPPGGSGPRNYRRRSL